MLPSILNSLFGCAHQRTTFPQTPARKSIGVSTFSQRNGTYVVCLDCGKEFAYDWKEMCVGEAVQPFGVPSPARITATLP